ncbi:MAG: tripartite tricarboxylate transporter substrate-binding protein [Tepidimonas sp.]|uniref:Bug family tripartite tricarboxylate transporter substrate binding protein n=1 Tax=Tepidimonas sp. TaxID=2002775 RepID=UPI00259F70C4|nr:tripartite tricarboxylate transporter substrate-binding protein [Tepidimonas sp.]MDM7456755.1 tripartite tricarboxylate transporter substrate-binding protein [Tepidimonas sp.]
MNSATRSPRMALDPAPARPSLQRRRLLQGSALAAAGVLQPSWAIPSASLPRWPVRPVRLLVGFPQGSSPDEIARSIVGPLSLALGQPVEVENRPGSGGHVAAAAVAKAEDDHTVGLLPSGHLTVARLMQPALAYDPLTDLQPVSLVATAPLVLCISPQLEVRGNAALRAVRTAGMAWHYGSPGAGTPFHLGMEILKAVAGWQALHVPYPGNPQVINALLQGDVQLALLPPSLTIPHWRAAKLPAVALTCASRSPLLPGVPTLSEQGVRGFDFEHWHAIAAPRGLAGASVDRLAQAVSRVLRDQRIRQRLLAQGWQATGSTPAALARRILRDVDRMRPVIERQQIRSA